MKSKITNKRKVMAKKVAGEIFKSGMKDLGKFMIFAIIALLIFAIVVPMSSGRAIPYFGLVYLMAYYFLFARKSTVIVKLSIVASALIMLAVAVSLVGR